MPTSFKATGTVVQVVATKTTHGRSTHDLDLVETGLSICQYLSSYWMHSQWVLLVGEDFYFGVCRWILGLLYFQVDNGRVLGCWDGFCIFQSPLRRLTSPSIDCMLKARTTQAKRFVGW